MEVSLIRLVLLVFTGYLHVIAGSKIDFVSVPDTITLGMTRNLTLRCALSDTAGQSNISVPIIGRRRREVKGQEASAGDVSPSFNTQHVMSLVVTKIGEKNQTVASVMAGSSPVGYVDVEEVQGEILSQPGERGYLEVTWSRPGADLSGMYECRVSALDDIGFPISYVQDIQVGVTEPSIFQLADRLWELEAADQVIRSQLLQTQSQLSQTESQLNLTESQYFQMESRLNQTQAQLTQTQSQLSQTESELTTNKEQVSSLLSTVATLNPSHAEQGIVYCSSWNNTDIDINLTASNSFHFTSNEGIESIQQVIFQRPYDSVPAIIISTSMMNTLSNVDTSGSSTAVGLMYQVFVEHVSTHGFAIRCAAWDTNTGHIFAIGVRWMSTIMG